MWRKTAIYPGMRGVASSLLGRMTGGLASEITEQKWSVVAYDKGFCIVCISTASKLQGDSPVLTG